MGMLLVGVGSTYLSVQMHMESFSIVPYCYSSSFTLFFFFTKRNNEELDTALYQSTSKKPIRNLLQWGISVDLVVLGACPRSCLPPHHLVTTIFLLLFSSSPHQELRRHHVLLPAP